MPQAHYLGLAIPDPDLAFDEATGHWSYGALDWDEFKRVIAGDGPCNAERMQARRKAHDDGAWVREAAAAFSSKHEKSQAAA